MPEDEMKSHQTESELLKAIFATPDDDDPRLVYADFLIDRGDPRGQFIVLQIERARTNSSITSEEDLLLKKYGRTWMGRLVSVSRLAGTRTKFSRGFISEVEFLRTAANRVPPISQVDEWRTVERLYGLNLGSYHKDFLKTGALTGLKTHEGALTHRELQDICQREEPLRSLESIVVTTLPSKAPIDTAEECLREGIGLPALRTITFLGVERPLEVESCVNLPVCTRLSGMQFHVATKHGAEAVINALEKCASIIRRVIVSIWEPRVDVELVREGESGYLTRKR